MVNSLLYAFQLYLLHNHAKGENRCQPQKISETREGSGLTTVQYITQLLTEYYEMKENGGKDCLAPCGS